MTQNFHYQQDQAKIALLELVQIFKDPFEAINRIIQQMIPSLKKLNELIEEEIQEIKRHLMNIGKVC